MRTYRDLFATPEFTPLFLASAGHVAGQTMSGLALGTLVHAATGSPLLTALAMFGPSLAQVLGATLLLSAADRLPPRAAMTGLALLFAAGTAVQALPGMPVWGTFAVLLVLGMVGALGGGVRYGLVNEVLPRDGYVLGRSLLNMCAGTMQIAGFALGGLLVVTLSARGTLLVGAGLYLVSAASARFGLSRRPARAQGRPSVAQTWRTNALLWSDRSRRRVYLALWVPNGLMVGAESLFVSYAPSQAGLLFACAAGGMLLGDILVGRFVPTAWRRRLGVPLLLLLAAPYLLFALHPAVPVALVLAALASVGFAASLVQQERLMSLTPHELSGHALGLHTSGMLTMQGVAATLAGTLAQLTSPAAAITVMGCLSLTVTLTLARGLRATDDRAAATVPTRTVADHSS
ncbi:MFS transporter [Streptomyces sp. YC504]|uniref:MFS transporter n=1 Tax=Streptomyces mesophilus TaxID=1775132 RepID=A0A6G4XKS9_9ACTN|nr:MFS transporter [Streptomyces mesophilus]NGO78028.1 MFS transporter [Streptomyces mesophilus]